MALQIHPGESKWWYARIRINGRKLKKNLGVEVRGVPPVKLSQKGDEAFERSRIKAQAALERLQLDLKKRSTAEELVQTIHEIRTGERIKSIPLNEAGSRWEALPRRRPLSKRYVDQALSWMTDFVDFLNTHHPVVREMGDVQPGMARTHLKAVEDKGVSGKTYNNTLIFLRSAFEALKDEAGIPKNPFAGIPTKEENTIFRMPFNEEELSAILEAAKGDTFVQPVLIASICTAMRRGDCCMLLKKAVDLPKGFINVKTAKTGEFAWIPIFPLLREVLEKIEPNDSPYVFPEQAAMYQLNPDHITDRVRKVMRVAGFFDPEDAKTEEEKQSARGAIHQDRPNGLRKASIRDFHSFRVTWVTLALTAGVPLEIVKKITGHRIAEIVIKHYFQPGREEFRRTLVGKLPTVIGGVAAPKPIELEEIRAHLEAMKPQTWKKIRTALLKRISPPPSAAGLASSGNIPNDAPQKPKKTKKKTINN